MIRILIRHIKRLFPERGLVRLSWHRAKSFVAALRYGFPARRLTVIGITGTDGKTTTVGMVSHILRQSGLKAGSLSTAFFEVNGKTTWNATQKTSPSPFAIQRFLRLLQSEGCTHAVLEYSSHGLVQGRSAWTFPAIAGITNTSPEHLDYHKSMERYRKDKGILFRMLRPNGTKVLHFEDETYPLFKKYSSSRTVIYMEQEPPVSFRLDANETLLWLSDISAKPDSTSAVIHVREAGSNAAHTCSLVLPVPGTFNLENALSAIGCALGAGISPEQSSSLLRSYTGVPGRMERIGGPQNFSVYVDFTVTPASYEKTLTALRTTLQPGKRLLVLTGSCGNRMREKRPLVGKICSDLADIVIVTNEDPYNEDPEKIIDDVWAGIDQNKVQAERISNRTDALRKIFTLAREGDAVLLSGKGSDTTMMTSSGQVPWNEREIAHAMLEKMFHQ